MRERRMTTVSRDVQHGERLHRMLVAELSGAGCFRPAAARTAAYGAFILASYAAAYAALLTGPGVAVRALALFALAFFSVQAGFLSHEAGHGAITRDRRVADLLGQVFHTLLTALCYSYFRHIHRLHHPHCNDRGRDPDMQSEFVSMYLQSALTKTGLGRLISRHQGVLIWILIGLQGFTLKIDSLQFLRRNPRSTRVDQCVVLLHYALWLLPPVPLPRLSDALPNYALKHVLQGFHACMILADNPVGTRVIESDATDSVFQQEIGVTRNLGASP